MSFPQAIETNYRGCRFRSRLEARWVVFFDAMGIKWNYEMEGFKLPSGCYLPDFWLPQVSMWAEVKPEAFTNQELTLCYQLSMATRRPVLLLDGMPDSITYFALDNCHFHKGDWCADVTEYDIQDSHEYWIDESRFFVSRVTDWIVSFNQDQEVPQVETQFPFDLNRERRVGHTNGAYAIKAARGARFEPARK